MTVTPLLNLDDMMKMFDPNNLMKSLSAPQQQSFDFTRLMDDQARNFEAVQAANLAAAEANKAFYERQMAIFQDVMKGATEQVEALGNTSGEDFLQKQSNIYNAALEKSLALMSDLAVATQRANEEAFEKVSEGVEKAIRDLGQI